jgi:hypothetical protein
MAFPYRSIARSTARHDLNTPIFRLAAYRSDSVRAVPRRPGWQSRWLGASGLDYAKFIQRGIFATTYVNGVVSCKSAPQGGVDAAVEQGVPKKAKPSGMIAMPPVLGMPAGNPFAPTFGFAGPTSTLEPRKIVTAKQRSSEFILDDGTTLTIRPVLIDAKRAKDQWAPNGKPVYILTFTNLTETDSPPKLMDPRFVSLTSKSKKRGKSRR